MIIASGDGFFKTIINTEDPDVIKFKKIESNLHDFNEYTQIKLPGWESIKDVKVYKNNIYISISEEIKKTVSTYQF